MPRGPSAPGSSPRALQETRLCFHIASVRMEMGVCQRLSLGIEPQAEKSRQDAIVPPSSGPNWRAGTDLRHRSELRTSL